MIKLYTLRETLTLCIFKTVQKLLVVFSNGLASDIEVHCLQMVCSEEMWPATELAGIWLSCSFQTAGADVGDLQYWEQQLEGVLDICGAIAAL